MGQCPDLLEWLMHTRRGFSVDYRHKFRFATLQCLFHRIRIDWITPWRLDSGEIRTASLDNVAHTIAKHTVYTDQSLVSGFEQVCKTCFHARTSGCRNGESQLVVCLKKPPQHFHDTVHDVYKLRIKMTNHGHRHRTQHTGVHIAWTGPH